MSAEKKLELFIFPLKGEKRLPGEFLPARLWLSPGWGRGRGERVWKGWVTLCSMPNDYNKPLQRKVLFPSWKSACKPGLNLTLHYAATKHAVKKIHKKKTNKCPTLGWEGCITGATLLAVISLMHWWHFRCRCLHFVLLCLAWSMEHVAPFQL